MRVLFSLVLLVSCSFAQDIEFSHPADLKLTNNFLKVCGRASEGNLKPSEHNFEAVKSVPPAKFEVAFQRALDASAAEFGLCIAYLEGIEEGWQEGHEHGVVAMQFPGNYPRDLKAALNTVSQQQLKDASLAMNTDVPCEPENLTSGDRLRKVLDYMRSHQLLLVLTLSSRVIPLALRESYPCAGTGPQKASQAAH
jgi:hypothetical protein